jgi:uncharacterized protein HemX
VLEEIQSPHGVRNRFESLSTGAKIGIAVGVLGAVAIGASIWLFFCIKSRRQGKKEAQALLAEERKEAAELSEYKAQMQAGRFAMGSNRV